jgi:nitroreductase
MDVRKQILTALNFRFACKEFDKSKNISAEDFNVILEAGRLSPSSFGLEPWKFLVLENMAVREKLLTVCWGAQKQLTTASKFIIFLARKSTDIRYDSSNIKKFMEEVQKIQKEVIVARVERLKNFQEDDFQLTDDRLLFDWACEQTYIALANMLTAAAFLGIDSCPIEGFNREKLETILAQDHMLNKDHFGVACMAAFGYRSADPLRVKTRRDQDSVVEWIE